MALCLSVCLSVCHKSENSIKRMKESRWFWHRGFLRSIVRCVLRKFEYFENEDTFLWKFFPTYADFCHGTSIIATCCQLSSTTNPSSVERSRLDLTASTFDRRAWSGDLIHRAPMRVARVHLRQLIHLCRWDEVGGEELQSAVAAVVLSRRPWQEDRRERFHRIKCNTPVDDRSVKDYQLCEQ